MLKKILFSCIMSTVKMFSLSNSRMQNHRSVSCLFSIAWRVQNLDYFISFFLRILICHLFSILFPFTGTYFVILLPSSPAFCQPSPFPLPKIFLTFFSPGTMQVGRILLSLSTTSCSTLFFSVLFFQLNSCALWYSFYQPHMYCCCCLFLIISLHVIQYTMFSWQNICNNWIISHLKM